MLDTEKQLIDALHQDHWYKFQTLTSASETWPSSVPSKYASQGKFAVSYLDALPTDPVNREYLKSLSAKPSVASGVIFWSTMAWGGMRRDHAVRIDPFVDTVVVPIMDKMREGKLSPVGAYDAFSSAYRYNQLCGLGPAFYTKLIFFCLPHHNGFIMDRWTARSINLLFSNGEKNLVRLTHNGFVHPANSSKTYKSFCSRISWIAKALGQPDELVEVRMFASSVQRHQRSPWRRYLIAAEPK